VDWGLPPRGLRSPSGRSVVVSVVLGLNSRGLRSLRSSCWSPASLGFLGSLGSLYSLCSLGALGSLGGLSDNGTALIILTVLSMWVLSTFFRASFRLDSSARVT